MLGLAREAHRRTGSLKLCLAGGVALNAVSNTRLLRETPFKSIWINPPEATRAARSARPCTPPTRWALTLFVMK